MRITLNLVLLLSLFIILTHAECVSPYWQLQNNAIVINEADSIAVTTVPLTNIFTEQTHLTTKSYWNLSSFSSQGSGDSSNVSVNIENTNVYVNNYKIRLNISFQASRTSGKNQTYKGTGTTSFDVIVNYTKQIVISNTTISFKFLSTAYLVTNTGITYSPVPIDENKNVFNNLILNNTDAQIKAFYTQGLSASLKQQIEKQNLYLTFGDSYTYQFGNFSTKYLMNASSFNLFNKTGLAVGYNATALSSSTCAGVQKPYSENSNNASFFSTSFCQELLTNALQNNGDWNNVLIDSTYQSNVFSFQMKDTELIIPDALKEYPNPFTKVYARCNSTSTSSKVRIDSTYSRIQADSVWNCSFIRTGGYGLVGFEANVSYSTVLSQSGKALTNTISQVQLNSIRYYPILFSVQDEETATLYVKSVLEKLTSSSTLGNGFLQFAKQNPKVTYDNNFVSVSEGSNNFEYVSI